MSPIGYAVRSHVEQVATEVWRVGNIKHRGIVVKFLAQSLRSLQSIEPTVPIF